MGWKKGLLHVYDRAGMEELLEEYLKAVPLLTIGEEERLKVRVATLEEKDIEIETLKAEQLEQVRSQQTLTSEMQAKDQKVKELEERMAKMSDLVEKLNAYVELYKPAFDTVMKQLNPHLSGKFIDIDPELVALSTKLATVNNTD